MVGAVVKENLIARFQAESDKAGIKFYAAARVENAIGISIGNIAELIGYVARGNAAVRYREIQQSAFQDKKGPDRTCGLKFRTKKPVNQAQVRTRRGSGHAADGCAGVAFKVIGHFSFQHYVRMHVEAKASAHSEEVLLGELEPGVVKKYAEIAVVFVIFALGGCRGRDRRKTQRQGAYDCDTFHVL